jgi:hypothetical protein
MSTETNINRFRIAFSFAGEKREFVEKTAQILAQRFGEEKILYDKFHEAEFARFNLGIYLPQLYGEQSELIVPVLCENYDQKRWTGWEWVHIYGLLTKADGHRVMPSRFDYANADGLSLAAGFIELDDKSPAEFASLILQRLAINEGKPKDHYAKAAANDAHQVSLIAMAEPVASVKQESAGTLPLSRLYTQVKDISDEVVKTPQLHNHPFLMALVRGQPSVPIADIYKYCCESDPNDLLWHISEAVKQANAASLAGNGFGIGKVSDLVAHMCLIAAARWISEEQIGKAHWVNEVPSMAMTEELAAAVVAATWFDLGLQLRYSADGKIEVANLICDRAETQFGVKTIEQVIDDEIYARVAQELSVTGLGARGKPHPRDVKAGINRLELVSGVRLMVGLGTSDVRQSVDSALRERIKTRWGIELFVFADTESQPSEDIREEWASVQTSLLDRFEGILGPLFLDSISSTQTTGGNTMSRKKVFISYAHKDDSHRKRLIEHLQVLENQQLVDIWDDRQIGAGQDWYAEIDRQLQSCKVAVFLVSPAFLGSKFISTIEVPTLLSRHQQQGMQVVPLLIRDCTWEVVPWLKAMQMRPTEAEPLSNTPRKRDQQLKQVALEIAGFCQ